MTQGNAMEPTKIPVEKRFPLDLTQSIKSIGDLYDTAKQNCWKPNDDVPWSSFDASAYDAETLTAARLSWSRRAWSEYTGLTETPALLVRFCLELRREADPKYFLTVRNSEEAWHVDVCHRLAEACGGYLESPSNDAYGQLFNQDLHQRVLNSEQSLDAYVAAHCAVEDGLELELWRGYLDNARDAVVRRILELCIDDKVRHAAFGWFYLEKRAPELGAGDKALIAETIAAHLCEVEFKGYHCAWMVPDNAAQDVVAADIKTAEMGLGALAPEAEHGIVSDYLDQAYGRLANLGINVAPTEIPTPGR
ncbi:MAG: hypothetical protein HOK30_22720 [Rhodospirillaceae bacterium]|nr:hypothetical protein [Rhodospirillaceae bacterium]MBT5898403.1 hypothetical protein [Rhodospirillaceae bacterium]MBT6430499.1 hypothetical protein [Rhodospirillaceae bacterium]MBT7761048.1 hypothetical protein [Rhodospirillaceae bacterium]